MPAPPAERSHAAAVPAAAPVAAHPAPPTSTRPSAPPPSSVSLLALVPPEPFGLPLAAWIGGAVYLFILLLFFGSML